LEKVGEDHTFFKSLTTNSKGGTPLVAIIVQSTISAVLIVYSDFKNMIEYISLILTVFGSASIVGLFVLRYREKKNPLSEDEKKSIFRTPLFPLPAIVFIGTALWMLYFFASQDPYKLLFSILSLVPGPLLYYLTTKK
jgi:APA family basic amino acid/polyamine antiporter